MNNDMMRRVMARDRARGRNRMGDGRRGTDYYIESPQLYSDIYGMGGRVYDGNARNRYTPRGYDSRESGYGYSDSTSSESDYARSGSGAMGNRRSDGYSVYPFEIAGRMGKESYPIYDFHGNERLSNHELKEWSMRLLGSVEEKDKSSLHKEHILKRAEELGIQFHKYSEEEFYVAVLMMYTDFCKTLGTANFDIYLRLAKDWLCDDDIEVRYGDKLAVYHDTIVEGM